MCKFCVLAPSVSKDQLLLKSPINTILVFKKSTTTQQFSNGISNLPTWDIRGTAELQIQHVERICTISETSASHTFQVGQTLNTFSCLLFAPLIHLFVISARPKPRQVFPEGGKCSVCTRRELSRAAEVSFLCFKHLLLCFSVSIFGFL